MLIQKHESFDCVIAYFRSLFYFLISFYYFLLSFSLSLFYKCAYRYVRDVLQLELPIIALTAEIGIDARSAALNAGANRLISKPAQADDIIRILDELIYLDF